MAPPPPGCISSSFEAARSHLLFERLTKNVNYPGDKPSNFPMVLQDLQVAYENSERQTGSLPVPLWFWVYDPQAGWQLGIDVEDDLFDACERHLLDGNHSLPLGDKWNCKLHIAPVGHDLFTKQIPFNKNTTKPITTAGMAKKVARHVIEYFSDPNRAVHQPQNGIVGEITSRRLRLVGLTWVSDGAVMPLLQVVRQGRN